MTNGEHKEVRPETAVKDPPKASEKKKPQAAAETAVQKDNDAGANE